MQSKACSLLSTAALLLFFHQAFASENATVGIAVNTTSGEIIGHAASNYPAVSEYLGIPFAEPPLKTLRFQPPVAYAAKGQIAALRQPLSCPQDPVGVNYSLPQPARNLLSNAGHYANSTSEDCLYLNVWTKFPPQASEKKPVMVWIYGGGFHAGGANDPTEQGAIFAAEQDVVHVNFNYRLGILGFSGAPGLTQNVGLLDQRMAVEWVRDNIEGFGGDASKITIFGHSAGGASVDLYNYAWTDDPIIAGSIDMTGTATSFARRLASTGVDIWYSTSDILGCGGNTTSSFAVLQCMQQKSAQDVSAASDKAGKAAIAALSADDQTYACITGVFVPTIDNHTVFSNYSTLGAAGKFIKRPVLTGNNIDEGCLFSEKGQIPVSNDQLITEAIFTCPSAWSAIYRASAGVPVWKYRWFGVYPNMELNVCPGKPWHGQEVEVLFGSTEIDSGYNATSKENRDGLYLRQAWAAFARNPTSGLKTEMGWPEFNSNESAVIELGTNTTTTRQIVVANATAIDENCFTLYRERSAAAAAAAAAAPAVL